ncbi:MAG: hypothetical protein KC713_05805, partial [Candidatus Omnitrophica bacterium]|nr:hypothetical protein [Candidatus Omnitrophota bacterium]
MMKSKSILVFIFLIVFLGSGVIFNLNRQWASYAQVGELQPPPTCQSMNASPVLEKSVCLRGKRVSTKGPFDPRPNPPIDLGSSRYRMCFLAEMKSQDADDNDQLRYEHSTCLLTIDGSGSWDFQLEADNNDVTTTCKAYCI